MHDVDKYNRRQKRQRPFSSRIAFERGLLTFKVGRWFAPNKSHKKTYPENLSNRYLGYTVYYIKKIHQICLRFFYAIPLLT